MVSMFGSQHLLLFIISAFVLSIPTLAQTPDSRWLKPDGSKAEFTDTYENGDSISLAWEGLNASICDLWLVSYDSKSAFTSRIAVNLNITDAGFLPWTIGIDSSVLDAENRFIMRFIPTGVALANFNGDEFPSPGFTILSRSQATGQGAASTYAASTTVTTSLAATTIYASPTSIGSNNSGNPAPLHPPPNPPLSAGAKAGAVIGSVLVIVLVIVLGLWIVRLRRKVKAAKNHRSLGIIPDGSTAINLSIPGPAEKRISGVHEMVGDRRQPIEMASIQPNRVTVYHELPT